MGFLFTIKFLLFLVDSVYFAVSYQAGVFGSMGFIFSKGLSVMGIIDAGIFYVICFAEWIFV